MTIDHLDPIDAVAPADPWGAVDHPMRAVTRQVALDGRWDDEHRSEVSRLFDDLADEWNETRASPERMAVVDDVFARGRTGPRAPRCLELGAGTGLFTPGIAAHTGHVVATDLVHRMVRQVPRSAGSPLQADGGRLPFADGVFPMAVLANMFLFPAEIDRILAPDGVLIWINSRGIHTPIHLTVDEVVDALPGPWDAVASGHGSATWAVVRRAPSP